MSVYKTSGTAYQMVRVYFTLNKDVTLTKEQAEQINDASIDALEVAISGGELFDEIEIDETSIEEGTLSKEDEQEIVYAVPVELDLTRTYEAPTLWYSNGDPGDPGCDDIEIDGGEITVDKKQMERNLKSLPVIGEFIKDVTVKVDEVDLNDIELRED